ncbi:MAG: hypothetical protein ACFFA7_00900, partial [Promethearchaeota archaeon]
MSERSSNNENNIVSKATLTILGSWIFAYLLTVLCSQIGLVLIHLIMGRTGNIIYLNPFEFYTNIPNPLTDPYLWLIGSNFVNMTCATIVFFIIWVKKSQYLLPLLMWAPAVFIVEGIMIISQFPGLLYGYWTEAFQAGLHIGIGVLLSIIFLVIGIFMMYLAKLLIYDVTQISRGQILLINIIGFPFWFIMNAFYFNFAPTVMTSIIPSTIIPLFNTVVEKPLLPLLSRKFKVQTKPLKWSHTGFSLGFAMIIIMLFIFTPFEPYNERAQIVNNYILIFFLIIGFVFFTVFISKKKKKKAVKKISVLIKDTKKIIPLQEKEEITIPEEITVEEKIIEEVVAPEEIPVEEEIIEEVVVPEEIPVEEVVIEQEVVIPEEILVDEEIVEQEVVIPEEIPVEEEVIEQEVVVPEEIPVDEEVVEQEVVAPEEIPVDEEVIEQEVVAPEEIPVDEEVIEQEVVAPE